MRLIDADKLLLQLNDDALRESPGDNESAGERRLSKMVYNTIQNCMKSVEQQPTIFNVCKVVEQLEEIKAYMLYENMNADVKWIDKAIKIVKEGGIE